jgi:hypothetical protein
MAIIGGMATATINIPLANMPLSGRAIVIDWDRQYPGLNGDLAVVSTNAI